jgi:hypothetical protein
VLLFVLIAIVWLVVVALCLAVCVMARRGDDELQGARAGARTTPDAQGARATPDAAGARATPDAQGARAGARATPDSEGLVVWEKLPELQVQSARRLSRRRRARLIGRGVRTRARQSAAGS